MLLARSHAARAASLCLCRRCGSFPGASGVLWFLWMYRGVIRVKYSAGCPWTRSWNPFLLAGLVQASQAELTWTITLVGVWMN